MVILNISLAPSQKMLRFHPPAALLRRRSRHVYVSEAPPRSATLLKVFLNLSQKKPCAKVALGLVSVDLSRHSTSKHIFIN